MYLKKQKNANIHLNYSALKNDNICNFLLSRPARAPFTAPGCFSFMSLPENDLLNKVFIKTLSFSSI